MENTVKFISTTQAKYDALVSKDAGSLYFTSDTHRIYKGSELFSISDVTNLATKSDATLTERGPNHDGFSAWEITWVNPAYPNPIDGVTWYDGVWWLTVNGQVEVNTSISDRNAVSIDVPAAKATRTALPGYILGPDDSSNPNRDKSLATVDAATLKERGLSAWVWEGTPPTYDGKEVVLYLQDYEFGPGDNRRYWVAYTVDGEQCSLIGDPATRDDDNTKTTVTVEIDGGSGAHTATRTELQGYQLGDQ